MDTRERTLLASAGIVLIFLLVQLGALALVEPFQQQGHQYTEDGGDASLSILYIGAILVVTAIMLAIFKYGGTGAIRLLIIFAGVYIAWFVFEALFPELVVVDAGGVDIAVLPVLAAGALAVSLYRYPEWYVIDAAGIVMGIGAAGLFGINLGILPVLVLLVGLAIYDAISVYRTKHMLTLASGMMDMRVPVVLVVPLSLSYSFLDADPPDPTAEDGETGDGDETHEEVLDAERDAMFIGLGDAIIPTILVASAAFFVDAPTVTLAGLTATLPAITAMVGTILGLVVLLWLVSKGRAHAGLPLLNGGAIAGYLVGALASGLTIVQAIGL